jgi:hypothetical protein
MTPKQTVEAILVKRLLSLIGKEAKSVENSDRPDVILNIDGRWIGVEVTELHPGDGNSGSSVRKSEERGLRNGRTVQGFHWGDTKYPDAIGRRLTEKIKRAANYKCDEGGALWLLVACQISIPGRIAATHVVGEWLSLDDLKPFESALAASRYERAFIYLVRDGRAFCWDRQSGWYHVAGKIASGPNNTAEPHSLWKVIDGLKDHPVPVVTVASYRQNARHQGESHSE